MEIYYIVGILLAVVFIAYIALSGRNPNNTGSKYKASDFGKSRRSGGRTQYYHNDTSSWIYLSTIEDDFDYCDGVLDVVKSSFSGGESSTYESSSSSSSVCSPSDSSSSCWGSSSSSNDSGSSYSGGSSYSSGGSSYSGGSDSSSGGGCD